MTVDFSLILVIATGVTGLVWALDRAFFQHGREGAAEPMVVEYSRSFFPVLLIVLLVRSFVFEPFRIPSSSMVPTLLVGDFIFVSKFAYGLRLPVVNSKIVEIGDPQRGDVVVFRLPSDPATNYIKRLVGLPGDKIQYSNKRLFINGDLVEATTVGQYTGEGQPNALLSREQLGDTEHDLLLMPGHRSQEGIFVVPQGHYFMMGDNRDNSRDSRYRGVGMVPDSNVVGKAVRIWMNWEFPRMPRWGRIGNAIE